MVMVKVKSHIRNGSKVKSYTRNSGNSSESQRVMGCTSRNVAKKFKELGYMTKISPQISTGNKFVDKTVAKAVAKTANFFAKDPRSKVAIKIAEKTYPYVEKAGANIARAKIAYDEICGKRK